MKVMKTLMAACSVAAMMTSASAQMVSYKVLTDNPDDYKRSMLYLDLFTAETYLTPVLGSAAKLETMVGGRIMPWAQVRFAWADMATHHVVSGYPTNAGGQKKQMVTDLGTAFFLVSKNKSKKVKVVLSSITAGSKTYSKYLMVPAEVKKQFGIEGGVNIARKALEFEDESHEFFKYKNRSTGAEVPIGTVGNLPAGSPAGEAYNPLSMTTIFSVYGGIHLRTIRNLTISSSSWGVKSNRAVGDLYVDVMLAPAVNVKDVVDIAGQTWGIEKQAGAIRNLGWRLGYTHHNSVRTNFQYNFEFGQKPGPVMGKEILNNGTYISLGMGLSIGSHKFVGIAPKKKTKESGGGEQ